MQIFDSLILNSTQPNFSRDSFETWAEMNEPDMLNKIDEGHISYCQENKQHYIFTKNNDNGDIKYEWVLLSPTGIIYKDHENGLTDSFANTCPPGTLVYAKDTGKLFYRYIKKYKENQNNPSGWFIPIITGLDLDNYITKTDADERYAVKSDISNLMPDYNPDEAYTNTWIGNNYIKEFEGQTGEDLSKSTFSYTELFDKLFFQEYIPQYTQPSTEVDIKDNLFEQGSGFEGRWYDEEKKIMITRRGSISPDASYFIPINSVDSYIQYPEGINHDRKFTNGVITNSINSNVSKPFCKIKLENGDWDYYKQEGEIYHIPITLTEPVYRFYLGAKFAKYSPLYNNKGQSMGYWDETNIIESQNYITIITSLPVKYNTKDGMVENELLYWEDTMTDYFELDATCKVEQKFMLPRRAKRICVWNDLSGYAQNLTFTESITGDYYTYTYPHNTLGHRGAVKIKVEF